MKGEDLDRWVQHFLAESRRRHQEAEQAMLAFAFFCGAVVLLVLIAAALTR